MYAAAQAPSFKFRFNLMYVVLFILTTATIVSYIYYSTTKHIVETAFEIEDAKGLMEEIYNSGVTDALKDLPLEAAIIEKMALEIESVLDRTTNLPDCELYFLRAKLPMEYPVLQYGDIISGYIFLNPEEPWKVGITTLGELKRYYNNIYYSSPKNNITLTDVHLKFNVIERGSLKEMLILEKILIYTYPLWSGHPEYSKPAGCKIYR